MRLYLPKKKSLPWKPNPDLSCQRYASFLEGAHLECSCTWEFQLRHSFFNSIHFNSTQFNWIQFNSIFTISNSAQFHSFRSIPFHCHATPCYSIPYHSTPLHSLHPTPLHSSTPLHSIHSFIYLHFFPQTVCPHFGVLTVGVRSGVLRGVLPQPRLSTVCANSTARFCGHGILGGFTGCPCTFWSQTWFYVTGAGDRMVLESRNVSLRGKCKESDTLWKSWQAPYLADVAKTLAGVHSKDCVLRGRRRKFAPWILCFEVKGLDSWERLHFWNFNLTMLLRGQCSISYDSESWFRGRRGTSETCFHFRGSLAENARFGSPGLEFSRKSRRKRSFWKSGTSNSSSVSQNLRRIFSFRRSLAENARFGSLDLQFLPMSCSFWKSGSSVFEEVSKKTLLFPLGTASRKCFRRRRFMHVAAVAASRMWPQPPLHGCYRSHRFKNLTAVTASKMLPQTPLQECDRSDRFKNVTGSPLFKDLWPVTVSRMRPQSSLQMHVTAVTASRRLPQAQSPLRERYFCHRFKNVTPVTVSRMWPQSPLQ